ncbi:MAG TPA: hypothetical protein VFO39_02285 [Candidatus Sulfotelmatobacter sp.]|nr:hypothetical protein [Candidatus Sulfotelmatobacter sp.]
MSEKQIRKAAAEGLKVLGHGNGKPSSVPPALIAKIQASISNGVFIIATDELQDKDQLSAFISGVIGLTALGTARTSADRLAASTQLRKAAMQAAV